MRQRLRGRRYTPATVRVGLACALGAAVCIVELGSGSGADTSFVPGDALARSQAISLAPTTGGLNYAITLATSISNYQDMEAQSLSQTIDLGAIGTSLEAQGCDGAAPTLPQSDVPPPVQAESTSGNQSLSDSITPQSSPDGLGIGNEAATATTQPSSGSLTTVSNISMPGGLLAVNGLTSSAKASDRQRRHAHGDGDVRHRAALPRQRRRRPRRPAVDRHAAVRGHHHLHRDVLGRLAHRRRGARRPVVS